MFPICLHIAFICKPREYKCLHTCLEKDILCWQVKDIGEFVCYLVERVRLRFRGLDVRGRAVGAANELLDSNMSLLRKVGDLGTLREARHARCLVHIREAAVELADHGIIPQSAVVSCKDVQAAFNAVRDMPAGLSNAEYFRRLSNKAKENAVIKRYVELVNRVWLLAAPESVVESMGNVVQDVFGHHRGLRHDHAALELFIRWNGPDIMASDPLLDEVQKTYKNKFVRTDDRAIDKSLQGTVMRNHKKKQCERAALFQ